MIEMPMTATKTYNEMVSSDPSIEAGLLFAGYTAPTVQGIRSWFGDRIVCDDANFKNYFLRLASPLADKFNAQLRLETIDKNFDPLVENYLERYIENGGEDKKTPSTGTKTKSFATITKTIKPVQYSKSISPASYSETITHPSYTDTFTAGTSKSKTGTVGNSGSNSATDTTNNDTDTKGLSKANPMSSTTVTTGNGPSGSNISGEIEGLTWTHSSSQEQATAKTYNKVVHSGSDSNTETYNLTEAGSGHDTTQRTYSGTEGRTHSITSSGSETYTMTTAGEEKTTPSGNETETNPVTLPEKMNLVELSRKE